MSYIGNQPQYQTFLTDTFSGNGSTVAFTTQVAAAGSTSALVSIAGVLQDPSTYGVSGNTLTFSEAPPSGTNNISVRYLGIPASGVTTTAYRTYAEYTATAGQTSFAVPSYPVGFISVFQNGVRLGANDYTATNGVNVVLAVGATAGDLISVEIFYLTSVANAIPNTPGSVGIANINATGTASASTFLRGDGSWQSLAVTPAAVSDQPNTSTGAFSIPAGTTAQRPASPRPGDHRYNTDLNKTEVWSGTGWTAITAQTVTAAYLLAAGGGGGGDALSGGAGAGGVLTGTYTLTPGTVYSFVVGAGGAGRAAVSTYAPGYSGNNSTAFGLTAVGGGYSNAYSNGSSLNGPNGNGGNGGSGGGAGTTDAGGGGGPWSGGAGTSGQGNNGGSGNSPSQSGYASGGGGGAGAAGGNSSGSTSGSGGNGIVSSITGSALYYGGGGGGGCQSSNGGVPGSGGLGGGGAGNGTSMGTAGTANTGGGAGGSGYGSGHPGGANGGSGVLIMSIPTSQYTGVTTGSPTVTTSGLNTILTFTSSGTYTA